jgi:hypothetical protein
MAPSTEFFDGFPLPYYVARPFADVTLNHLAYGFYHRASYVAVGSYIKYVKLVYPRRLDIPPELNTTTTLRDPQLGHLSRL